MIYHANCKHKKAGVAILISNKMKFEKAILSKKKVFPKDRGVNTSRRQNNPKCVCAQLLSFNIPEERVDKSNQ